MADPRQYIVAPTSEPTILISNGIIDVPTSEPTEYYGKIVKFGMLNVLGPTSEPTEFREASEWVQSLRLEETTPTNEPTIFHADKVPRPTCENSADCAGGFCNFDEGSHGYCELCSDFDSAEQCHHDGLPEKGADECSDVCFDEDGSRRAVPTAEPTRLHSRTSEPTIFGELEGTSEPTIFGGSNTNEPTVFGVTLEPTLFSNAESAEPTLFSGVITAEPTVFGEHVTPEPTSFGEVPEIQNVRTVYYNLFLLTF